ncbi:hybrid sensor histidine kinase/response regulator [Desulforhopalus sp. IMCC35007]|uniref:hybrid sensor histidine kinase/response regulator n=1 Tax=Desulforhopalus sp. IMCC35007 TaxID=2569543 RepID=UPI0010AE01DB|nr:hybrid sensor histidine kinase/response regulator [Desulforhopalus sp. IMCC35007]TKB10706.1 response regulator [Desulforhopalus sp. IMCC35007]
MNSFGTDKKSQSPSSAYPMRSIRVTTGSGILITGVLFTAISIIALLGFYSYQKMLQDFSARTLPMTTQEAQISILMSQLLQQIHQLQSADSPQKRRIATVEVNSQLSRITTFIGSDSTSTLNQDNNNLDFLKKSISTLNTLVLERILTQKDLSLARAGLIVQTRLIYQSIVTLLTSTPFSSESETIKAFGEQALRLINDSQNKEPQTSLFQLNEKSRTLAAQLKNLDDSIPLLPFYAQDTAMHLVLSLKEALVGENGFLSYEKQYLAITNDCSSQAMLIQNFLENKGDTSMTHFFDLTTSVARNSSILSEKVNRQIKILTLLFVFSLLLSIAYFIYFQRFLLKRLTNLNKTVLAMVAGENLQIQERGRDEITEIANSINYFSNELHEAKSAAEKSAVQKSEFLAHMSHEIRTPLNAILGFSDLALKTNSPTEHLDYLSKINNASHSLLGIINSTLDLSKMEAGKFTIDNVEFDLRNVFEELASIISLKCEESGLHFYYNIEPDTPCKLIGDPLRLNQVLTNLITNAFKFTEEGNITLQVSAKNRLSNWKNKTTLLFSVQDTGKGISEEHAQLLFQPFTQADNSITRKFGGTGLGLAICKNLVGMMGGDIWLKSNETKGTTFSFTSTFELIDNTSFYLAPDEVKNLSAIVMSRLPQSATELSLQLGNFGCTIFQTLSVDEILAQIEQNTQKNVDISHEIIFIDCEDLSFDWQEAVKAIKISMAKENSSPLVLTGPQRLAAHFHAQNLQKSDYFLITPITPARLLDAITTVLDIDNPYCLQKQSLIPRLPQKNSTIHGGATILLVEDNDINSQIAVAYLKSRNLAVIVAHNGAEALEILLGSSGRQINAILMDIQMPVMDGYTATKAIRELDSPMAGIPIIAVTAHAMPEERDKCLAHGMNAYITKPINTNDLFKILGELVGEQIANQLKQNQTSMQSSIPDNLLAKNASLNMKTGLAQVMNDPGLYMDLLISFVKKYRGWPADIKIAFDGRDLEKCRHLVHTLKGVSGNLGMEKLFSLSVRLELGIRGNEISSVQQLLSEIEEETTIVCDFLRDWLDKNRHNQWQPKESPQKTGHYHYNIEDLTEALSSSLKNNSSKALKQIQLLRSQLGDEDSYVFNKIEQHAKDLDFGMARDLLSQWQYQYVTRGFSTHAK